MSGIVERLRELQQDMAEVIERLDSGVLDNGIMRVILLESHDLYKNAANEIEKLRTERDKWRALAVAALRGHEGTDADLAEAMAAIREESQR